MVIKDLIDFDDINTWPKLLIEKFNDETFCCNDYETQKLIRDCDYVGYHCTRLEDAITIKKYGLMKANSKRIKNLQVKKIKQLYSNYNEEEIKFWVDSYDLSERLDKGRRGNTIHFLLSLKSITQNSSCNEYFKNFGGEILRDLVEKNVMKEEKEIYSKKIEKVGKPYIIKFRTDYMTASCEDKNELLKQMYNYYYGSVPIQTAICSFHNIKKEDILDIIDATIVCDYIDENLS